jgi:methyl-accepting chemotaxis protein
MKWFDNLKIGTKLIVAFMFMAVLATVVGYMGLNGTDTMNKLLNSMHDDNLTPIISITNAKMQALYHKRSLYALVLEKDPESAFVIKGQLSKYESEMKTLLNNYRQKGLGEEELKIFNAFNSSWPAYIEAVNRLIGYVDQRQTDQALQALNGEAYKTFKVSEDLISKLVDTNTMQAQKSYEESEKVYAGSRNLVFIITLGAIIVALGFGIVLSRKICKPLEKAVVLIQEMGSGHLGKRIEIRSEDEVGILAKAMNQFADNLQNVVVASLRKIAQGDISVEVAPKDSKDEITPALKSIIDSLRGLVSETDILIQSAKNGQLDKRGQASKFSGSYRNLIEGINDTLDAVTLPINEAAEVLDKIAARDLTARVRGEYKGGHAKIKNALNTTIQNLDEALCRVAQASEQVSSASSQISGGSQSLSQGSSEQASSLEEVSSSLQEVTSMARQNNANSKEAWNLAKEAELSVEAGVQSMTRLSEAIDRIKASSDSTAKIIKSIDDIAFQTNLLALNAAVEAARAGDAGKGFAVVAEEVRNLAMRSAAAAKNTANLIDESVKNSEGGVSLNQEVLKRLKEIDGQVKKVGAVMAEIASATEQQSMGVDQVTSVISQMTQVTQQIAANAEESASGAEELSSQAEEMRSMVNAFHLSNTSTKSSHPKAALPHPVSNQWIQDDARYGSTVGDLAGN